MSAPRRNGQPSSCEPCRKSKLRCDHSNPVCQRCSRRGKGHLCVYHPAPLTRRNRRLDGTEEQVTLSGAVTAQLRSGENALRDRLVMDWNKKMPIAFPQSATGMTSYSAVLKEYEEEAASASTTQHPSDLLARLTPTDQKHIQLGAQILLLLEDFEMYESVAEAWWQASEEGCVLGQPLVHGILALLKAKYVAWTQSSTNSNERYSDLLGMSTSVFDNTAKNIGVHSSMTPQEYMTRIALRWEGVGLIFSVIGLGAMLAPHWRSAADQETKLPKDQRELGVLAIAVGDICLQFCDSCGSVSDPLSWLLFQHIHLMTVTFGDSDRRPWRRLADLSTVTFTLGLNQSRRNDDPPFFLSELRKRLMSGILGLDKQLATFLGRPPQVSTRFCNVEPPLDLSYEQIFAEPGVREEAIRKLDSQGWNTSGCLSKAAYFRVILAVSPIREQILELSLSKAEGDVSARIHELFTVSHEAWNKLPDFLHWRQDRAGSNGDEAFIIPLYLEFLYNDFLLYRILYRKTSEECDNMLRISFEILGKVLELVQNEFTSRSTMHNVSWNAAYFGIPSASVLAIHLLQLQPQQDMSLSPDPTARLSSPHQSERTSLFATNISPSYGSPDFRRPEIIQNLSAFVSYLQSAIRPHEGNYDICQQARRFIRNILDRILCSPSSIGESSTPMLTTTRQAAIFTSPPVIYSTPGGSQLTPLASGDVALDWLGSEKTTLRNNVEVHRLVDDFNYEDFIMNNFPFAELSNPDVNQNQDQDQEML